MAARRAPSNRAEQIAWYFYDWANSAFSTTVVTLLLGPYLAALAKNAAGAEGYVYPLGIPVDARSYWSYLVTLSVLLQVVCLPVVGAVADASRRKKRLLGLLAYAGAGATVALYRVDGKEYLAGGALFLAANLAFGASVVVYNSFLPEISTDEERDAVSGRGWGFGYLGGGLLLALNLLLLMHRERLGLDEGHAVRICLLSAGAWWGLFTLVPMRWLRNRPAVRQGAAGGFRQLAHTLASLRRYPQTLTFLAAYFLYNDAIQAVITLSSQFGADELKMSFSSLALLILMVQFLAFVGALAFIRVAAWLGAKRAVMLSLVIWSGVLVAMYAGVRTEGQFFAAGAVVSLVLGGSQALSRSLFSRMIPPGREAEYFSLYEVTDKGSSWLAPLVFGLALQFTGSYRLAILSLIVFFVAGLAVLAKVDVGRAAREAGSRT